MSVKNAADAAAPYSEEYYLLFGEESGQDRDCFDYAGTAEYLKGMGFADNSLSQTRKNAKESHKYAGYKDPAAQYCDFCGRLLVGAEYDVLKDGRVRCVECSHTVINKTEDFEAMFSRAREGLCLKYGIDLPSPIAVKVVSQKKISRMQGKRFVPTRYFDARTVGVAINKHGRYYMLFENGAPRASLIATAAHELTHIWQYSHWNWALMQAKYGSQFLAVCEGMAKWAEIQYLYLLNETAIADRFLEEEAARTDVYGYGLRLFLNEYPMSRGICLEGDTPFLHVDEPIVL